jgi:hypothetical protein
MMTCAIGSTAEEPPHSSEQEQCRHTYISTGLNLPQALAQQAIRLAHEG